MNNVIQESDLVFWSRQLSEHALFLHLGIEVEPLKSLGLEIHEKWENFRKSLGNDITFTGDNRTISLFNLLTDELKNYKLVVLSKMTACQVNTPENPTTWMGWMFPTLVEHIIRELNYAHAKINGLQVSIENEVNFWRLINKEHALFTAHLLDPSESDLIQVAYSLAKKIENDDTCESQLFIKISLHNAEKLDEFHRQGKSLLDKNQVRSIIHPVLLSHVIREGQRSVGILNYINQNARNYEFQIEDDIFNDYSAHECNKNGKVPKTILNF